MGNSDPSRLIPIDDYVAGLRRLCAVPVNCLRRVRPPAWLVRIFPGTSAIFGPPRRMCSGWNLPTGVRPAGPPATVGFAPSDFLNDLDPYWRAPHEILTPGRPFVVEASPARLLAPGGWVVVNPDTFVYDTSFWGHRDFATARRWHSIFLRKKVTAPGRLAGRVLSLASDFAPYSFGHWLIDSLPRWLLAERAGLKPADFDTIYLPTPATPSTRQLVTALGLPPEKLITAPAATDLCLDHLTATSFPGSPGSACSLAREMAVRLHPPRRPLRRLYLARDGHRRNFVNHEALRHVFAELGFEACNPATDPDTIAKCAEARVIVGIEGSQCFNALFAPSGGALVVIAPDGFHPLPYMQSIAACSGLALYLLGARSVAPDSSCVLAPAELRRGLLHVLATHP